LQQFKHLELEIADPTLIAKADHNHKSKIGGDHAISGPGTAALQDWRWVGMTQPLLHDSAKVEFLGRCQ
jgi:hypothetical protein